MASPMSKYLFKSVAAAVADFNKLLNKALYYDVATRYEMAFIVQAVVNNQVTATKSEWQVLKEFSTQVGISANHLKRYLLVARRITPRDVLHARKVLKNRFNWSSLIFLSAKETAKERRELLHEAAKTKTTVMFAAYGKSARAPWSPTAGVLVKILSRISAAELDAGMQTWLTKHFDAAKVGIIRAKVLPYTHTRTHGRSMSAAA